MDFVFDWDNEGDRFSFDDSDRFDEDSLCSWISEPESLCQNWRGWKRQNGGQQPSNSSKPQEGRITSLVELSAQAVACHIPFEVVEHFPQPIPDEVQLRIAFWSFPENEEDIRLYSCLANGSADEFQKGEHLYKTKSVKDALQIGFHLSATLTPPAGLTQNKGSFQVAVVFDRRRISSCTCTCNGASWCSHVVALCLYRIHQASAVTLRAPVSESLSRLHRDQLQKFAQYLISELPQQILPTAQRLLDELLSSQKAAINTVRGAPDPTAGPSANEQTSWCLDEATLHENVKKTLVKFCVPSPMVFSDVNYLSATAPPAAAEWQSLLRPLRGREPEGMWNLLSIVREMFRRNDTNAIPLLEIITDEVLQCEQILIWWFTTKTSPNSNNSRGNGTNGANATQHAASSLCDEIVTLWRLAALNPKLSPIQRDDLCTKFKEWHISTVEKVKSARGSSVNGGGNSLKKSDFDIFVGFKPGIETCRLTWDDYQIPGVTYSENESFNLHYRFSKCHDSEKKRSRIQPVTVCSENLISTDNNTTLAQAHNILQDHHSSSFPSRQNSSPRDSVTNDGALSSGSEGFCEPERSSSLFRADSDSGSEMKEVHSRNSYDEQNMHNYVNHPLVSNGFSDQPSSSTFNPNLYVNSSQDIDIQHFNASVSLGTGTKVENSSESQQSGDEGQVFLSSSSTINKITDSEVESTQGPTTEDNVQDILFARAEALHAHGHTREACRLAQRLAEELLTNPPDLLAETANLPLVKGKKKKALTNISLLASSTLSKAAFLCSVLTEEPECYHLAFKVGIFGLEMPRPPASCKSLEVKLAYQESELICLLKKIPLGPLELNSLRERAQQLHDGILKSRGDALLPLTLASFIFDSLCLPLFPVGSTNSRPPSRSVQVTTRLPGDEKLGFEGAVAALGMKANVSEAEHPLLCESTRRQRGELAIAMLVQYKDDLSKLSKIMEKLLDREVHQSFKAPSLVDLLGSKSPCSQPSVPMTLPPAAMPNPSSPYHQVPNGAAGSITERNRTDFMPRQDDPQNRHNNPPPSGVGARPKITYPRRVCSSGKDTDSSTVEEEDAFKALDAKLKMIASKKKPSQGMASIDSSAPETTSSDNSPTLVRRPFPKHQGPGSDCGSSGDSDSLGSSSSGEKSNRMKNRENESPPNQMLNRVLPVQVIQDRNSTPSATNVKNARFKGKNRIMPTLPNQPSEASAHFMFELSKTVLAKAGGNSSTSLFTQPSNNNQHTGPHRNLHLCAFQIGLYALGLNNCVSPNWLSRTYSSHVSWISGQAMEIGTAAINILIETWEGHLTPPEAASLADRAARGRDPNMVRAAAELALSCLPQAQALNPSEVQRALFQCKEQSRDMLEKACLAVESAAKGGGVYPDVLFDVARHWFELSEKAAQSGSSSDGQKRSTANVDVNEDAQMIGVGAVERGSPANLPVIPFSSSSPHQPVTVASATLPPNNQIPAQPLVFSYAALPPQPAPHQIPHQAFVQHYSYVQQIPPFSTQIHHQHIPIHPYVTTFTYQGQPIGIPNTPTAIYPQGAMPVRQIGPAIQVFPSHTQCQVSTVQTPPSSSANGQSMHPVDQQVDSDSPSPPHVHQAVSGHHNQAQLNYLSAAFRTGMLAMETLARRVHDDRPQAKYARNPPYGDNVKWLLNIAVKLGTSYIQQFCMSAVNAVVSPFVLYDIAIEAAHVLARNNPAIAQNHLRSTILNPIIQKCTQMFIQCAHQRIHHISQADYDDFVSTICSARNAFCLTQGGMIQFQELLQSLRRSKSCRKELWTRIMNGLATGNV